MNISIVHDELIDSLAELRQALPTMRLGQLIANMATVARGAVAGAVWEMEDDELLRRSDGNSNNWPHVPLGEIIKAGSQFRI